MEWSITIESYTWWLSNDKNAWQKGSFYDCWNVDIRKNIAYAQLSRWVEEIMSHTSKVNVIALTNNVGWTTIEEEINTFHDDWTIQEDLTGEIWKAVDGSWVSTSDPLLNVVNDWTNNWIIAQNYIYSFTKWVRENILATNTFASWWTGTNWSAWVHTPWSSGQYSETVSTIPVSWERYHIVVDVTSQSAWTCTVQIGWTVSGNLAVGRNDIYLTTVNAFTIFFNPSSTSTIVLWYIRVDRVSDLTVSNWTGVKYRFARTNTSLYAPALVWNNADIIYGAWTSVSRINKDGTHMEYSTSLEQSVIGWLAWTVRAITQVWDTIYIWCNWGGSTIRYTWDWITSRPNGKIVIADKPVVNCALLNNEHYWWTQKGIKSQKYVFQGAAQQNNLIVKSDVPRDPTAISSYATGNIQTYEQDRLALYWEWINAIETFGDIVYLPWYGKIYGFGKYYPSNPLAFDKSFVFNGTECTAMFTSSTATVSWTWYDYSFYLLIGYKSWSSYYIGKIDMRDWNGWFATQGYIDSLEYMSSSTDVENEWKKYTIRFYLPHSSTSIKVYKNVNQAGFVLHKTIDTTAYSTGFNVAEVWDSWIWDTIQYRFELITSNSSYTPRIYVGSKFKFSINEKK